MELYLCRSVVLSFSVKIIILMKLIGHFSKLSSKYLLQPSGQHAGFSVHYNTSSGAMVANESKIALALKSEQE